MHQATLGCPRASRRHGFRRSLCSLALLAAAHLLSSDGIAAQRRDGAWSLGLYSGWADDDRGFQGLMIGPAATAGVVARDFAVSLRGAVTRGAMLGAGSCSARTSSNTWVEQPCDATALNVSAAAERYLGEGASASRPSVGVRLGVASFRGSTGASWAIFGGTGIADTPWRLAVSYEKSAPADLRQLGVTLSVAAPR